MNKEKDELQREKGNQMMYVEDQEIFAKELVQSITEREFVNHAELRDKISEAKAALDALEQTWAKAEEARDKLEKFQGKRQEVK